MKQEYTMRFLSILMTIVSSILFGVIVFLGRESFLILSFALSKSAYLPRFLDKVYLVLGGLIWLMSWFYFEMVYSKGITRNDMTARFLRATGMELIALFVFGAVAAYFMTDGPNWTAIAILAVCLLVGIVFLLITRRRSTPASAA